MPRHVQPKSLYKVALMRTVDLINSSCHRIECKFGNYDGELCRDQVTLVQKYLLQRIPGLVLDEVFNELQDFGVPVDPRIVFAIYMHKDIKHIDRAIVAINKLQHSKPNDEFWISNLPRLQNLVHLNLKLNCTDGILQAVGNNCPKLEYIDIVSKMMPDSRVGNALKIKFFVSDQGLRYLAKCTALRTIDMNTVFRRNFGGQLTVSGVRLLLKSLPNLSCISFHYMGEVLAQDMDDVDSLALVSLCDYSAQSSHMEAIARLCPNLTKLVLHCAKHESDVVGNETLTILAKSDLHITALRLEKFYFGEEMRILLLNKGCILQSLILNFQTLLSTRDIELIGRTCPNITTFHLLGFKELTNNISAGTEITKSLFSNLEVLAIVGQDWTEDGVVQLCLSNALKIQTICLYKCGRPNINNRSKSIDEIFGHIRQKNPMKNLVNMCLCTMAPMQIGTIEYFCNNCAELTSFLTDCPGMNINKDFLELQRKIQQTNLDLDLNCTSVEV